MKATHRSNRNTFSSSRRKPLAKTTRNISDGTTCKAKRWKTFSSSEQPRHAALPCSGRRAYPSARTRQTRPATAMTQSSTLRKACWEMCLTTGKAMQVPRMTPGAPYMAQVSTVGV